jgi:hypothetical protein
MNHTFNQVSGILAVIQEFVELVNDLTENVDSSADLGSKILSAVGDLNKSLDDKIKLTDSSLPSIS